MGVTLFRDNILRYSIIRERFHEIISKLVEQQQYNNIENQTLMRDIYQMLIDMGMDNRSVYEVDFEASLLQQLAKFYQIQSQNLLHENSDLFEYIAKISTKIEEINQWAMNCFDNSTKERIIEVLNIEFITKNEEKIVHMTEQSILSILTSNKLDEFEIIYKYLMHIPSGYSTISNCVSYYLHEQGKSLEANNWEASAQHLLALKDKLNNFLDIATKYDPKILTQVQYRFTEIVNMNAHLVKYISSLIEDMNNFDSELFKKLILLYYSKEKLFFEQHYQKFKQQLLSLLPNTTDASLFIEKILYAKDIYSAFIRAALHEDKVSF